MDPKEARRTALVRLGGVDAVKEQCRDVQRFGAAEDLWRDLRYGLHRVLARPTFGVVAVATLAIGMGGSTATFSIADAVLMRPLPVHEQRNLSVLWGVDQSAGARRVPIPYGAFKAFVDASPQTLSAVAGLDYHGAASHPVHERGEGVNLSVATRHRESVHRAWRHTTARPQHPAGR